jgi:2-polyprenyl-6-methoxyphenol hydroxylase-like FAD-dependent oxidoreductase
MKILVVGAGIGGLTFIRSLQYFHSSFEGLNCSVQLAERSATFRDGVGIVLHPNGLKVMEAIGLSDELKSHSNVIGSIVITKDSHNTCIDLQKVWGLDNQSRALLRKDLHALLLADITKSDSIPVSVRMGCSVEQLFQEGNKMRVQFERGATESFDLVIAADGVHSTIRQLLFPAVKAVNTDLFYFRFVTQCEAEIENPHWKVMERKGASYGFIPLTENRQHCFVQLQTSVYPCLQGKEEEYLKESIIDWDPLISDALSNRIGPIHGGFAYMVPPGSWSKGNCVLLGDASHAVSPTLSEGGSLAMEDALALSLALYGANSITEAIHFYQQAREERCMWAYRMALSQLNSLRKKRTSEKENKNGDSAMATRLMAGMYKPFLQNQFPEYLQSLLLKINSTKAADLFTNLRTN